MPTTTNEPTNDREIAVDETVAVLVLKYNSSSGLWEPASTTQISIDTVHDRIHEGRYFSGGYYNAAVANNATIQLLLVLGATHSLHAVMKCASGGNSVVELYEDTTYSAAGTAVAMTNHNRSSDKVFAGTVTHTPTITGVGTPLNGTTFVPGGTGGGMGGSTPGGSVDFSQELVLAPTKVYLFRITNIAGSTQPMSIQLKGYQPAL